MSKKRVPLGEPYMFLGNERPSRAIRIGIRHIGCFVFILYNIVVDLVMKFLIKTISVVKKNVL